MIFKRKDRINFNGELLRLIEKYSRPPHRNRPAFEHVRDFYSVYMVYGKDRRKLMRGGQAARDCIAELEEDCKGLARMG